MRTIIALCLLAAAHVVHAEQIPCETFGRLAEAIMQARQEGVPLQRLMQGNEYGPSELEKSLLMEAYSLPRFHSDEGKKRAVVEYQNSIYLECLRSRQ